VRFLAIYKQEGLVQPQLCGQGNPTLNTAQAVAKDLFREFTKILAKQFAADGLHRTDKDFVDRCIKLLRRKNYRAQSE